jgi:hypothetical protein
MIVLLGLVIGGVRSCDSSGSNDSRNKDVESKSDQTVAPSYQTTAPPIAGNDAQNTDEPPPQRVGIGIALSTLVNKIPLLANNPPQRFQLADGTPQYRWYFDASESPSDAQNAVLVYTLNGPDSNLSLAEATITSDESGFSDDKGKLLLMASVIFLSYAANEPLQPMSDDLLIAMKKPYTEWHLEYPPNVIEWMVDRDNSNYRLDFTLKHQPSN